MIQINNLWKRFGDNEVLKGLNLTIERGKTTVIIGGSGCGKSVLLKHIIGLLKPDEGSILIDDTDITKLPDKEIYGLRNKFGFLFQGAALFDSMTVAENIGLGLSENTDMEQPEIDKIVAEKLELVKLPGTQKLKPAELSGGMRKRVGLARALACSPEFILYDEPTTGLDPVTSISIDNLIKDLAGELEVTSIVVTHDIFTVYEVGDWAAMMYNGIVHWEGTPIDLKNATDPIVCEFLERTDVHKTRTYSSNQI